MRPRHEDYILYEKRGRRYYPVREYDGKVHDAFPKGFCMVHTEPGSTSYRYTVEPDLIAIDTALKVLEDGMMTAMHKRIDLKPEPRPLSEKAIKLWRELEKELQKQDGQGEAFLRLWGCSAHDVVEAGVKHVREKLLEQQKESTCTYP